MRVKCIKEYFDKELNKAIKPLEEYEVSDARANIICSNTNSLGYAVAEIVKEAEPKTTTTKKKATKKKEEA